MQPRNTSRSEDAKNIASDLFRTGACISGRQQKWLQCIIQMFSWLMNRDRWISVADCQYLNSEKVFGDFFWESHSNLDRIYLSQGFGNYFWKPWDKESPTKVMRARPQPYQAASWKLDLNFVWLVTNLIFTIDSSSKMGLTLGVWLKLVTRSPALNFVFPTDLEI